MQHTENPCLSGAVSKPQDATALAMGEDTSPRYQTSQWTRIHMEGRTLDPAFKAHLIDIATPHQKVFSMLMEQYDGHPVGVECRSESRTAWAFVCPNVQTQYSDHPWRVQHFDEHGFSGHECYTTMIEAIESLIMSYPIADVGALDRASATPVWATGLRIQAERDLLNQGRIGYAEFAARCITICDVSVGELQGEAV